jgi:hypothetical protein
VLLRVFGDEYRLLSNSPTSVDLLMCDRL